MILMMLVNFIELKCVQVLRVDLRDKEFTAMQNMPAGVLT